MAITSAITDLVNSLYELLSSIVGAVYWVAHSFASAVVGVVTGFTRLVGDVVGGAVHIAGGVGKFLLGNIVFVAVGVLLAIGFVRYTAQGQRMVGGKKIN